MLNLSDKSPSLIGHGDVGDIRGAPTCTCCPFELEYAEYDINKYESAKRTDL